MKPLRMDFSVYFSVDFSVDFLLFVMGSFVVTCANRFELEAGFYFQMSFLLHS